MAHKYLKDGTKMTKPQSEYHQKSYHAIMDYRNVPADATDDEIARVLDAYKSMRLPLTGYTTYTAIKQICKMTYPRIFAAIKTMHQADPYSVRFTVNRLDENTKFRLL